MRHTRAMLTAAVTLALAASVALAQTRPAPTLSTRGAQTYYGQAVRVGNGTARTWVTLDPASKPVAIGLALTDRALSGLPNTMPYAEYVVPLPREAAGVPFTHVVINWNPRGHFPPQIYGAPHFDFHFYTITSAVRQAMTLTGPSRTMEMQTPPQAAVPPGYMTVPGAEEAHMGVHWVDQAAPELHGRPFAQTFVYGYYMGQLAFLEPMVTRSYLQTHPDLVSTIKLPGYFPVTGFYPTQYSIHYSRAQRTTIIALEGLTLRVPPATVTASLPPIYPR